MFLVNLLWEEKIIKETRGSFVNTRIPFEPLSVAPIFGNIMHGLRTAARAHTRALKKR